ncbi:MAG: translation elongation factor Ts [Dehalococcoidales bacterium]
MEISIEMIKELRDQCGAGIMECRNALLEVDGDMEKALQIIKEKGLLKAAKKAERVTTQGLIEAYVHTGGRVGALVEVNCETDFVARTDEFKELAHDLAMQVAALSPQFITKEEIPEGADVEPQAACLLLQPYIRDPGKIVRDVIAETIAKVGENIKVRRFSRFEIGG